MGFLHLRPGRIAAALLLCASGFAAAVDATLIEGREYVPLSGVAAAREMDESVPRSDPKEVAFTGPEHSLVVREDGRQILIDGVRHWLSFPAKRGEGGEIHVSSLDVEKTIEPALDPTVAGELPPVGTIVFDPGHGGHDRGGKSVYGNEKEYALDVVNRARKILESRGFKVVQSRLGDSFVNLSARPAMTKNYENPIFVSIHFNAAGWRPAASGMEIFALTPADAPSTGVKSDDTEVAKARPGDAMEPASFVLANTIYQTLLGEMDAFDRGVKRARFSVLRNAEVPAVLIEGGFLTNPEEARKIHSPEWRQKYAMVLADGIMAYLDYANEGTLPPRARDRGRESTEEFVPED